MFTGIIEELGTVTNLTKLEDSIRVEVEGSLVHSDLKKVILLLLMEFV